MRRTWTAMRRSGPAILTIAIFLLSITGSGVELTYASDNITSPPISFNPLEPVSIASGFIPAQTGGHLHNVAFVTTRRLPSCNQERVVAVDDDGRTTNFATLPARTTLDGCSKTDIDVVTNGTSPFASAYLLNVFVSRVRDIYRIPLGGVVSTFATLPASGAWGTCARSISIAFDPGPAGSGALFNGDLLAACVGADTSPNPAAHIFRIDSNGQVTYVTTVDDSVGRIDFAPKNWRSLGFRLLVFEADTAILKAISPSAVTPIAADELQQAGRVSVYAIPGRFCNFNGGVFIATDSPNKRLIRFTDATFESDDHGDVLLVTQAGARYRGDSVATDFSLDSSHSVPFEDADWCGLMYSALAVKPSSVSFDNNGIATGNISVVILSFLGPPAFGPVAELLVETIRCGADGNENPFSQTSTQDYNGDGIPDLHGHFKAEGSGLARGQTPVCTGHTGGGSHDVGFW